MSFSRLLSILAVLLVGPASVLVNALSSTLQQVSNFGPNPTGVQMFLYRPTKLASPPPLIIAMHYCTGTAQAYFQGTSLAQLADTHGFIVVYPDAPDPGGCWDVHSTETLTHDAGGDSLAIASMVRYAIANYGVDASRVFATGTSSGAMMTNVLMGAYPDLFKAGSLFSGVPYGCFAGPGLWNSQCAQGQLIKTGQQWGDQVRSGFPGFTGTRPKVQFWHGTADTTLYPQNFQEEIKQWTNVFGVSETPTSTQTNNPLNGYTRTSYGPNVQAILAQGVGHTVPEQENDVMIWFELNNLTPGTTNPPATQPPATTPPATTPTQPTSTTIPSSPVGTAEHWGQCGGQGWTGPTGMMIAHSFSPHTNFAPSLACVSPFTCTALNAYYSQCL